MQKRSQFIIYSRFGNLIEIWISRLLLVLTLANHFFQLLYLMVGYQERQELINLSVDFRPKEFSISP